MTILHIGHCRRVLAPKGFTLVELMIVVAIIGILAAIAIPNFSRFRQRAYQAEARAGLRSLYNAQSAHYADRERYDERLEIVGFRMERGNRYAYYNGDRDEAGVDRQNVNEISPTDAVWISVDTFRWEHLDDHAPECSHEDMPDGFAFAPSPGTTAPDRVGVTGTGPYSSFFAQACGRLDRDEGIDSWAISSVDSIASRQCPTAEEVPVAAGEPVNTWNDVHCEP